MIKRINQFFKNIVYGFKPLDEEYIDRYLSGSEKKIFLRLKKSEQYHSILIAKALEKDALENERSNKNELVRLALFHDIGKTEYPMNIVEKSIAVILRKMLKDKLKRLEKLEFISSSLYHGERGEEILRREGVFDSSPYCYQVVGLHHHQLEALKEKSSLSEDFYTAFALLKKYDDLN
ncbi:MAG: HD domain-containing protein [Clostridiaceae bacterium]